MDIVYKYFQISQDGSNINYPRLIHDFGLGVRNEPTEEARQIFVKDTPIIEYTDFLEKPFLLISDAFKKAVNMYNPEYNCQAVVLSEKGGDKQTVYWYIDLPSIKCFPETDRDVGSITKVKTLDKSKIYADIAEGLSFFKFQEAATTSPVHIIRLDLAESVLRRNGIGFVLRGLESV